MPITTTAYPYNPISDLPHTLSPEDLKTPDNYNKAARSSKRNWLMGQVDKILGAGLGESQRLQGVEESRGQRMEDLIGAALPEANKPTWTDEAFNMALGQGTSAASQTALQGQDFLRSMLGGAGITGGGLAAGLGTNIELSRLGQITDSRRALYIERTKQDALDRARNFQNSLVYANAVNREPSTVYADFLSSLAGVRLGQLGLEVQRGAAKDAAKAGENAGWMSLAGSLGGAALGLL